MSSYLESVKKQFGYYKSLGFKTIEQLSDEQLFWQPNEESNSVGTLVKHLNGNMLSRWTAFLTTDGEKEWRKRDEEFENDILDRTSLIQLWDQGWDCLLRAIDELNEKDLEKEIFIRNMGQTVIDAINRQLCHYSYHIGQMVFIGTLIKGEGWQSLSIPKEKSTAYNKEKFSKPKSRTHFTDDL